MLRLVDKPIAYYLLLEAYLADIRHVIFIIHSENTATKDFFESEKQNRYLPIFQTCESHLLRHMSAEATDRQYF